MAEDAVTVGEPLFIAELIIKICVSVGRSSHRHAINLELTEWSITERAKMESRLQKHRFNLLNITSHDRFSYTALRKAARIGRHFQKTACCLALA